MVRLCWCWRGVKGRGRGSTHTGCGSRGRKAGWSLMETERRGEHTQNTELSLPLALHPSIHSVTLPSSFFIVGQNGHAPVSPSRVSYGLQQVTQGVSRSLSMLACMCMSLNGECICVLCGKGHVCVHASEFVCVRERVSK